MSQDKKSRPEILLLISPTFHFSYQSSPFFYNAFNLKHVFFSIVSLYLFSVLVLSNLARAYFTSEKNA